MANAVCGDRNYQSVRHRFVGALEVELPRRHPLSIGRHRSDIHLLPKETHDIGCVLMRISHVKRCLE